MRINPGYEDPFRKKKHTVLAQDPNGGGFFIMERSDEPIELLNIQVSGKAAINLPNSKVIIADEDHTIVSEFNPWYVEPQEGEPDENRLKLRNEWLDRIMKFLLPPHLFANQNEVRYQKYIQNWFKKHKIQIEMRPDGGAVRIWRDGEVLSSWGC